MQSVALSPLIAMTLLGATLAAEVPQKASTALPAKQDAFAAKPAPRGNGQGVGHKLLLYIPNRIFDVLDIVRARVRLGPGLALGTRVTKYTDLFMGSYTSIYLGLPGPRQVPRVPWPGGIESRSGLAASVADATTTSYDANPRYAVTEIGLGLQAVLVGAEVGVDPLEVFDMAFGVLFIDFREDDL